jgi:hypothetical protein
MAAIRKPNPWLTVTCPSPSLDPIPVTRRAGRAGLGFPAARGSGMAAGGWLAGAIYDYAGFYAAAFAAGIIANLANLAIIGTLAFRQSRFRAMVLLAQALI